MLIRRRFAPQGWSATGASLGDTRCQTAAGRRWDLNLRVDPVGTIAYVLVLFNRFLRLSGGDSAVSDSDQAAGKGVEIVTASCAITCGARTRGGSCERTPVPGKRRCRRHGGAPGHGAPKGNRNAETHGLRTREALAERRWVSELIRDGRRLLEMMEQDEDHD
jgi:hypothetical protein